MAEVKLQTSQPRTAPTLKKPEPVAEVVVSPVFGRMVNPITGVEFAKDTTVTEIDSWLRSQIDAGKMVVVK